MRTIFEPDEQGEYLAARALLVRRCVLWAQARGLTADPLIVEVAFDSRHFSADGRLAWWTPDQVRRLLLDWIPAKVTADLSDLADAPETVRTLLAFLADSGLRDPRGGALPENDAAVTEAAVVFPEALADSDRWGMAKFVAIKALRDGVDLTDADALNRFTAKLAPGGPLSLDDDVLTRMVAGPDPNLQPPRAFPQPPVTLPGRAELARLANESRVLGQVRGFVDWVSTGGKVLTAAGNLKVADARALVALLDTGDAAERARTAADLPRLALIAAWAKKARLVRVAKGRLLQVAKARPLLGDPLVLWERLFGAVFELRETLCVPTWTGAGPSMLHELFDLVVPDVLNSVYGMSDPVPVARLAESVWLACEAAFDLSAGSAAARRGWRATVRGDLDRLFDALDALGAVTLTHGLADPRFSADLTNAGLADDSALPPNEEPFVTGEAADRLREALTKPGPLIELSPLGTWAMRSRLLAEGRDAGLVGELASAPPAQLLGVISEHYGPDMARTEIAGWLDSHDGDRDALYDAVRSCPFRGRAQAMLDVLAEALGDPVEVLRGVRHDPALAPLAISLLVAPEALDPDELAEREAALMMTEAVLGLLELRGPEFLQAELATEGVDPRRLLATMRAVGHPADAAIRDFEELVAVDRSPCRTNGPARGSRRGAGSKAPRSRRR